MKSRYEFLFEPGESATSMLSRLVERPGPIVDLPFSTSRFGL
jgi:hypothetical protein